MKRLDLAGRTAIITGASRGIGLAAAQAISAAGGNVVMTSRRQESADAAATEVSGIAFLVSDAASWVTGETFVIDGGQRLGDAGPFQKGVDVA